MWVIRFMHGATEFLFINNKEHSFYETITSLTPSKTKREKKPHLIRSRFYSKLNGNRELI